LTATNNKQDNGDFKKIPLDQLLIGEWNIRQRDIAVDIDELAQNMDRFDLQHPIVVQPKGDKYEIIIGQRRFLAAKQLGWKYIDAKVKKKRLNEFDAKTLSFSENIQRRDISPRDKAEVCEYLLKSLKTPQAVAEHLGTTEQTVRKWLGYAGVPNKLKDLVEERAISVPAAMRLAEYVLDEEKAVAIAKKMAKEPKRARDRLLEAAEENPRRPLETIYKRAEEKRLQKKITFVLPEKWSYAMDRAVKRLNSTPNEIAKDATIEWLQMMKY
jgi:ParB family chromosome partitioning protein